MKKNLIYILLLCSLACIQGCKFIINKYAFYPDHKNIVPSEKLPEKIKEVFIETCDNKNLQSYFIACPDSNDILIYFHGNAGNISHRIPDLLKLNSFGMNILGVSYRGYGKSEGSPSEEGIYLDGEAAYQYVTRIGYRPENIIIFGRSIGTTVAIHTSQNRNIKRLILVSPLTSGKAQAKMSGMGFISSLAGEAFNNIGKIQNIKCPVLIIHGSKDNVIPLSMGQEIYQKTNTEKHIAIIEGAGHNNLSNAYQSEYWPPINKFINGLKVGL